MCTHIVIKVDKNFDACRLPIFPYNSNCMTLCVRDAALEEEDKKRRGREKGSSSQLRMSGVYKVSYYNSIEF